MASAIYPVDLAAANAVPSLGSRRLQRQAVSAWQWFSGWVRALVMAWRIHRAEIDPNAKCPSCGARKGKIRWEPELVWPDGSKGCVLHTCEIDGAVWAEKPIVQAKAWEIQVRHQQGDAAPFVHRPVPPSNPRSFQ
jgi:hypothetical protein